MLVTQRHAERESELNDSVFRHNFSMIDYARKAVLRIIRAPTVLFKDDN